MDKIVTCTSDLWNVTCVLDPANIKYFKFYFFIMFCPSYCVSGKYKAILKQAFIFFWTLGRLVLLALKY